MVISKAVQETVLKTKEEWAAKNTQLMREVQKNPETGFYEAIYPIQIFAESITYVLDADNNKIDIYDRAPSRAINLTEAEINTLWSEQVTLADGTVTVLGLLLADRLDAIVETRFEL